MNELWRSASQRHDGTRAVGKVSGRALRKRRVFMAAVFFCTALVWPTAESCPQGWLKGYVLGETCFTTTGKQCAVPFPLGQKGPDLQLPSPGHASQHQPRACSGPPPARLPPSSRPTPVQGHPPHPAAALGKVISQSQVGLTRVLAPTRLPLPPAPLHMQWGQACPLSRRRSSLRLHASRARPHCRPLPRC